MSGLSFDGSFPSWFHMFPTNKQLSASAQVCQLWASAGAVWAVPPSKLRSFWSTVFRRWRMLLFISDQVLQRLLAKETSCEPLNSKEPQWKPQAEKIKLSTGAGVLGLQSLAQREIHTSGGWEMRLPSLWKMVMRQLLLEKLATKPLAVMENIWKCTQWPNTLPQSNIPNNTDGKKWLAELTLCKS